MLQMSHLCKKIKFTVGLSAFLALGGGPIFAQNYSPPSYPSQPAPQLGAPPTTLPPTVLPPATVGSGVAPPSQVTAPPFDPFQPQSQSFPMTIGGAPTSPVSVLPPQQQYLTPGPTQFTPSNYGGFPQRWPETNWAWPAQNWAAFRSETNPKRFFDRTRFRSTTLTGARGGKENYLSINTIELATTMTFKPGPSSNPLRVSPGFAFHWWGGPKTFFVDLPPRVYDAFLAVDYCSNQCNQTGFETDFTIGVFSDFKNLDSYALRMEGVLLGWFRPNQTHTFKFGAEYLGRQRIKILPAFGVFITPTPDYRLDLYFPRPRIAQRVRSFTNGELWCYISSEYGGGSWAVERNGYYAKSMAEAVPPRSSKDRVDINDIRSVIGFEYLSPRGRTAFFEVGYVSNRDIILRSGNPTEKIDLRDTIMMRSGFVF